MSTHPLGDCAITTTQSVCRHCVEKKEITNAEYNKAEKALRNFKTQEELGKLLGISSGTINKIMKEYPDYFLKQQTKKTEKEHHY